ncbi:MAG: hypothetical protein IJ876_04640 [Elusimicrobiaceae bacterium]|nr:hypothetical protein [Elusimicrobiaceae bacterium]
MTGLGRFFMLLLCTAVVMICFPDFGTSGWAFAGTIILVWTGIIIIMGVVGSLFGLYRFEGINRFLTWVLLAGILFSLLWYFPQDSKVSPINQLKHGEFPTGADLQRGLQKFTFNFAFDRRNARRDENFINQKDAKAAAEEAAKKAAAEAAKKAAQKARQKLDIIVEEE